jgi:hypothetical protein
MQGRLDGRAGCIHIAAGENITISTFNSGIYPNGAYALIAQEDTTFSSLLDNFGGDLLVSCNLSGKTLKAGSYISVPDNISIDSVKPSSGSVICYIFDPKTTG